MNEITSPDEIPADGMITIRPWDGTRRQGWHIESGPNEANFVVASPVNIATAEVTGHPRDVHMRWGVDTIEVMP